MRVGNGRGVGTTVGPKSGGSTRAEAAGSSEGGAGRLVGTRVALAVGTGGGTGLAEPHPQRSAIITIAASLHRSNTGTAPKGRTPWASPAGAEGPRPARVSVPSFWLPASWGGFKRVRAPLRLAVFRGPFYRIRGRNANREPAPFARPLPLWYSVRARTTPACLARLHRFGPAGTRPDRQSNPPISRAFALDQSCCPERGWSMRRPNASG